MDNLEKIIKISRYIQVGHKKGLYTIDANVWLKDITMYTANIRGNGNTLEEAANLVISKMDTLEIKQVNEA